MTRTERRTSLAALAAAFAALAAAPEAWAQATDARRTPSVVRVHVADSTGAPVADAELSLVRGLRAVLATGRTDASGNHEFIVDLDSTDYSVVARKMGFARGDRFFSVERAAVNVAVTMKPLANGLPTVTVTADDAKRRSYHIDADDIAAAEAYVSNALDVVERLRPDMIISRSGAWGGRAKYGCDALTHIWVNDRRYDNVFTIVRPEAAIRARGVGNRPARMGTGNMTTLMEIAPEHIAEMNYRDCFDTTEKRYGTVNALFVVLKEGVAYRPGRGTFVVADDEKVATAR